MTARKRESAKERDEKIVANAAPWEGAIDFAPGWRGEIERRPQVCAIPYKGTKRMAHEVALAAARILNRRRRGEDEVTRESDDAPCGECHPCVNYAAETFRKEGLPMPHKYQWDALVKRAEDAEAKLAALERQHGLLRDAVNQDASECDPGCDSYAHTKTCRYVATAALVADRQREIERLRAHLSALKPSEEQVERAAKAAAYEYASYDSRPEAHRDKARAILEAAVAWGNGPTKTT